jgi:hypothetical protein
LVDAVITRAESQGLLLDKNEEGLDKNEDLIDILIGAQAISDPPAGRLA